MKRSIFFLIAAIFGLIFGALMLFSPGNAAEGFGLASTPETSLLFRILGSLLLGMALLNFLVRNHEDSSTLKAILIVNVVIHAIGMVVDLLAAAEGVLAFAKIIPGEVVHLFVGIGSIIYLMKVKLQIK